MSCFLYYGFTRRKNRLLQLNGMLEATKALTKRLDFLLDFIVNKKSREKSSRLATLLSDSTGVEWSRAESSGVKWSRVESSDVE